MERLVIITIKVPASLLIAVDSVAIRERVSRSEVVRRALKLYISKYFEDVEKERRSIVVKKVSLR